MTLTGSVWTLSFLLVETPNYLDSFLPTRPHTISWFDPLVTGSSSFVRAHARILSTFFLSENDRRDDGDARIRRSPLIAENFIYRRGGRRSRDRRSAKRTSWTPRSHWARRAGIRDGQTESRLESVPFRRWGLSVTEKSGRWWWRCRGGGGGDGEEQERILKRNSISDDAPCAIK